MIILNYYYTISSQLKYHAIQTRCCKTLHNPQPNQVHMMSQITCPLIHPLHSLLNKVLVLGDVIQPVLICPAIFCPLHYPQLLVLGVCYVIQPFDLFPSSVQHCVPIDVTLSQSTMLVVASCWTRKRIHITPTFTFKGKF